MILSACSNTNHQDPSPKMLQQVLLDVNTRYGFSAKGFDTLQHIFAGNRFINNELKLNYYHYASQYFRLDKGDYVQAINYADSMLLILKNNPNSEIYNSLKAKAYMAKADALQATKSYQKSYQYYYEAKKIAEQSRDVKLIGEFTNRIGQLMYSTSNYAGASSYFKKALKEFSTSDTNYLSFVNIQGLLDNIGLCYLKINNTDSAILYFNNALAYISIKQQRYIDNNDFCEMAKGVVYGNLGQAYLLSKDYSKAEDLFLKDISINSKWGFANEEALMSQQNLAELYFTKGDIEHTGQTLQRIRTGLDSIGSKFVRIKWNYLMSRYCKSIDKPYAALNYFEVYKTLKEQSIAEYNSYYASNTSNQLDLLESKYHIILLKKNSQIQITYLLIALVILVSTIAMSILLLRYWRKSKKHVQVLTSLNDDIQSKQLQLKETLGTLKARNKEKEDILRVVAHDLRNPISAAGTLASLLINDDLSEEEKQEFLLLIQSACNDSLDLIGSLMEAASEAAIQYKIEPVDVNAVLHNCTRLQQVKAGEKKQDISLSLSDEAALANADVDKLNRVVANLLTNAIKFSPCGSRVEVSSAVSEELITIEIKDNGIGIPDQYQNKIFHVFTEARRPGTNGEKTFGVGLSICKQIVEDHGGRIWFTSKQGEGTSFFVSLPKLKEAFTASAALFA